MGLAEKEMAAETHAQEPPAPTSNTAKACNGFSGVAKQLRRACDCCRKRKIRCDAQEPCGQCMKASIRCAYLQPPKKKGPKGLRSARVLHALRKIDDTASGPSASPVHAQFGDWKWGPQEPRPGPSDVYDSQSQEIQSYNHVYQRPDIAPSTQPYFQSIPSVMSVRMPQQGQSAVKLESRPDYSWSSGRTDTGSLGSESIPQVLSPTSSEAMHDFSRYQDPGLAKCMPDRGRSPFSKDDRWSTSRRLPEDTFLPYVQLFFTHMFAIMPVIDRSTFLDTSFYTTGALSPDMYCFLTALCSATTVQLDDSIPQPQSPQPGKKADHLFAEECLRERRTFDHAETMSPLSIMTSFFLFAYYGNHEKHFQAWHYLQESITCAENLEMDDEASYEKLDPVESQWRRRLYWLLFITERAYAVQRRKHTRLHASVALPAVFESEDPQLLAGFVNLANLFSAVDESFVSAWRGSRRSSLCDEAWLARTQKQLDTSAHAANLGELTETQHLDIGVTREWLHVLAWQLGVSNGLIWGQGEGGMRLDYPVELARKVVEIVGPAKAIALDSHGIGMEQKLSDIAGCLADVLKCTAGDTSATFQEGKQYLNILLGKLSTMRGKESRYLKPLLAKMEGLPGYEAISEDLALPTGMEDEYATNLQVPALTTPASPRWSMNQSVSMLRTLSFTGTLGMPGIYVPEEDWTQRRPSARVLEDHELELLQPWLNSVSTQ